MKVTLINYTQDAKELLLFTKGTRLGVNAAMYSNIKQMDDKNKAEGLKYMANTIPSSWEFVDYVFLVEGVSRAYTHQQVRTRAGSYAQQTMRVTDQADYNYICTEENEKSRPAMDTIAACNNYIRTCYRALLAQGQKPEDARGILPTNISTNIVCKFNLRTLSELVASRSGGRTQDEYRRVIGEMTKEVLIVHPWAEDFLFQHHRDYFKEIETYAQSLSQGGKNHLLKIVDKMRKE